jgi:histidinol phosphatase-like PHP family hydrolase
MYRLFQFEALHKMMNDEKVQVLGHIDGTGGVVMTWQQSS